jgi:hypothetical protein
MLIKIDSLCIGIWKIYLTNQFRERKYNEISQHFAKFREIKITFVIISYFAK